MRAGFIYLVTCIPTGKVYVGKTLKTVKERWAKHVSSRRRTYALGRAICKYGEASFTVRVLDIASSSEELKDKERLYITLLDSNNSAFGYNLTEGGDGSSAHYHHTLETCEKLKRIGTGRKASLATKQKMAERRIGVALTESTKRKIGAANRRAQTGIPKSAAAAQATRIGIIAWWKKRREVATKKSR